MRVISLRRAAQRKKCILVTDQKDSENLIQRIQKEGSLNIQIVACVNEKIFNDQKKIYSRILYSDAIDKLPELIHHKNASLVIIAFAKPEPMSLRRIIELCQDEETEIKKLTYVHETGHQLKSIQPEELLSKKPISLDNFSIEAMIRNKVIMVTGAGGSIGSEICRQVSRYQPKLLIFFEITELFLYNLEFEFEADYPNTNFISILGNIQDEKRIEWAVSTYKPDVIFHAAAYKHVPMMEKNPMGAIRNNIKGSWQLANVAMKYCVERFVLISTDKAVNPINVMGASKRVCELICQHLQVQTDKTKFLAVRFGNVLGSAGSVVHRFKEQIDKGGPVTITHPDIKRYFMSISEACQLVMQAGAIGNGGEIFILDMEEPIKILSLAEQIITLAGYIPGKDIKITFTGLRPGEKLYEELLTDAEATMATTYPGVRIAKMSASPYDLGEKLESVFSLPQDSNADLVKEILKSLVPEFQISPLSPQPVWDKRKLRLLKKGVVGS